MYQNDVFFQRARGLEEQSGLQNIRPVGRLERGAWCLQSKNVAEGCYGRALVIAAGANVRAQPDAQNCDDNSSYRATPSVK